MPLGDAKEYASFLPKPYADADVEHLCEAFFLHPRPAALHRFPASAA